MVISHNKTLAAQLYSEFKEFFPHNAVEYFVSYYDYYQPEAYIPSTNTYIEKDLSINEEIERLRLSTTSSYLRQKRHYSSIFRFLYLWNRKSRRVCKNTIHLHQGFTISRNQLLHQLVSSLYSRTEEVIARAKFRVKGDIVDIFPAHGEVAYRLTFWGDTIESIEAIDPLNGHRIESLNELTIYPANIFVTSQDIIHEAIREIQIDLELQKNYFKSIDKHLEAKRLEDRVIYDIEMIKVGLCSGIENYSRYLTDDKRYRPFCLLDYFPKISIITRVMLLFLNQGHV